ncbi:caspase domain-containing protein [Xylaria acuta]|nr:caspase domain-containing protein [Xylaria acuta]
MLGRSCVYLSIMTSGRPLAPNLFGNVCSIVRSLVLIPLSLFRRLVSFRRLLLSADAPRGHIVQDNRSPHATLSGAMSGRAATKTALLIGIDRYDSAWVSDLKGCVEDIKLAEAYVKDLVGIPERNIVKLLSPSTANLEDPSAESLPTRDNVISAFEKLASDAQENDIIYIHYSGHGVCHPTQFPHLKPDDQDESIALVRHNDPSRRIDCLIDVEIAFLLKNITDKGALVTIVLDCCHSGGATRTGVRFRGVGKIPLEAFPKRHPIRPGSILEKSWARKTAGLFRKASVMEHWMTSAKGAEFLAACQANQTAREIETADGVTRGLLTECLSDVLNKHKSRLGQLSCEMVYNLVSERVTERKAGFHEQDVVFGGQRSRSFFSADSIEHEAATVITCASSPGGEQLQVSLNVGKAHGVAEGDLFEVYPADKVFANITDYNISLATFTVTDVDDFASTGRLDGSTEYVQRGCKAMKRRDILKLYALSCRTAAVFADGVEVSEQKVQEVRNKIRTDGNVIKLTESDPFFEIRVKPSGNFEVSFTHKDQKAMVFTQSTDVLLSYLTHLSIYYNLFNLGSPRGTSGISVEITGVLSKGIRAPEPQILSPVSPPRQVQGLKKLASGDVPDILEGDSIEILVRNTTHTSMYLEIIILEPSWKVSRIHPNKGNASFKLEGGNGVHFFITMSLPTKVKDSVQPEMFDSFVFLATTSNQRNFPVTVLPVLRKTSSDQIPWRLGEAKNQRGGAVVDSDSWFVQRLDVCCGKRNKVVG